MSTSTLSNGVLGNLDLQQLLQNLSQLIIPLSQLVLAISFLGGVAFIFKGVVMLHQFGQVQNQMSKPHGISGPFIYICIGAILMYLPATTNVFSISMLGNNMQSFFSNNSDVIEIENDAGNTYSVNTTPQYDTNASNELMQYASIGIGQEWASLINTLVMYIQLVGFIAFVRGWFILSSIASPGGAQQGAFGKGLIHIIGGIIAINFVPFMHALATTIGLN